MLLDLLLIMLLGLIAAFFWQLRNMAEVSQRVAMQACTQQTVQLLSVAMESARPSLGGRTGISWRAKYLFEFSTDGFNHYQGYFWLQGSQVTKIQWPVFPEPEWHTAPPSKGNIGCCPR